MLPPEGVQVGQDLLLSTIHTLVQMQPGHQPPPRCGGPCGHGRGNSPNGGGPNGGAGGNTQNKVSLCASCGGRLLDHDIVVEPIKEVYRHRINLPSSTQFMRPIGGSGADRGHAEDDVIVVAYGQDWCGWSKKMEAAVSQAHNPQIKYVTTKPAGAPDTNGFPAIFAMRGSTCKLLKMGFVNVADPHIAKALMSDAAAAWK